MSGNLASNLVGKMVNDWFVESKLSKVDTTGGNFSSGYVVRHKDGRRAFMKAINIGYAVKMLGIGTSRTDLVNQITADFKYEREILQFCEAKKMDRIVVAIDSGEYDEPSDPYFVPYLVFDFCIDGDVRRNTKMRDPTFAWRLRVFHGVCVGVMQLHSQDVAHQDLKPSNVLVYEDDFSKIADLGRSTKKGPGARFDAAGHCGDLDYCPIELHYGHFEPDWDTRRKAVDLYMLGGILAFLVSNIHIFGLILTKLPSAYHPRTWTGDYKSVMPAVQSATYDSIAEITAALPKELQQDVRNLLLWLCHPDPKLRGHPDNHSHVVGDRFSVERIISVANTLAERAAVRSI